MSFTRGLSILKPDYNDRRIPVMEHCYGLSRATLRYFSGIDPMTEPKRINQAYRRVAEAFEIDLFWGASLPEGYEETFEWEDGQTVKQRRDGQQVRLVSDWPDKILIGNINSQTLAHGTLQQIEHKTRRCIEVGSRAWRFVVNVGGGLTHDMSVGNLQAYLDVRKRWCREMRASTDSSDGVSNAEADQLSPVHQL